MRKLKEIVEWGFVWGLILPMIIVIVILTNLVSERLFEHLVEPINEFYLNTVHSKAYEQNQERNAPLMSDQNEKLNRLLKISNISSLQYDISDHLQTISDCLPESVLYLLEDHHVLIEFVDYNLSSLSKDFLNVAGFYDATFKKIYIQTKEIRYGYENTVAIFLHEVGHAVDHLFKTAGVFVGETQKGGNLISNQPEFQQLFLQTRDVMMNNDSYGYDDSVEYFAQMFYLYYYAQEVLANRNPDVFAFMEQLNEELK